MDVFITLKALSGFGKNKEGVFCWWDKNSLALYLIHLPVLSLFGLPSITWWYVDVPGWLMLIQLLAILGFMIFVAKSLEDRKDKVS